MPHGQAHRRKWRGSFCQLADRMHTDILRCMAEGFRGSARHFTEELRFRGLDASNAAIQKALTVLLARGAFRVVRMRQGSRLVACAPTTNGDEILLDAATIDAIADRVIARIDERARAGASTLRGLPLAEAQTRVALEEIEAVRRELAAFSVDGSSDE